MLLRARILLPVERPAIEDGAVVLARKRIVKIARWKELSAQERCRAVDLGESILLPGLINSHCHLDYTDMAGKIPPRKSFADWVKALVALKGMWSTGDFTKSWRHGAEMLLRNGVTTVANIESVPELVPALWDTTPLRVISFREIITLKNRAKAREQIELTVKELAALPPRRVGLSPHAPYTTYAETLQWAAAKAKEHGWPLSTHVSESEEEFLMFNKQSGPLYSWLGSQRDMSDCGLGSPVQHLERCGYLHRNLIAIHLNYLDAMDAALLAKHRVTVVHCPRSHAYFNHRAFPWAELTKAGVNLCLGTDSLASALCGPGHSLPELDLFREMQLFARNFPEVAPEAILQMATSNGAKGLRRNDLGRLAPGAKADLIAIPFAGDKRQAAEAVVQHQGEVSVSMIEGKWAIKQGTLADFASTLVPSPGQRPRCHRAESCSG